MDFGATGTLQSCTGVALNLLLHLLLLELHIKYAEAVAVLSGDVSADVGQHSLTAIVTS